MGLSCSPPQLGVNPWSNARWEEHLFDCSKCLEVAFKCFQPGLCEIQRVFPPLGRRSQQVSCLPSSIWLLICPLPSQIPFQPACRRAGTQVPGRAHIELPAPQGSLGLGRGRAGWCELLSRIFWRKCLERSVSSPVASLNVAVGGVSAAKKPGCDTQDSCCSLILTGFFTTCYS